MNTLKLGSKNTAEARILEYLTANASDALAAKINAGTKTLGDAMKYCEAQARKQAAGASSAYVDDATVFGWAVHFFEEDNPTAAEADSEEPDGNTAEPGDDGEGDDDAASGDDDRTPAPSVSRTKQASAQAELDLFGGEEADDE